MQRSAIVPDGDGLKWISCKFFLLAERNWQEKPPHEAFPITVSRIDKTQIGHGKKDR